MAVSEQQQLNQMNGQIGLNGRSPQLSSSLHHEHATFSTNGRKRRILYFFGRVWQSEQEEEAYINRNPRYIVFNGPQKHVLAVRYSNSEWKSYHENERTAGFRWWAPAA